MPAAPYTNRPSTLEMAGPEGDGRSKSLRPSQAAPRRVGFSPPASAQRLRRRCTQYRLWTLPSAGGGVVHAHVNVINAHRALVHFAISCEQDSIQSFWYALSYALNTREKSLQDRTFRKKGEQAVHAVAGVHGRHGQHGPKQSWLFSVDTAATSHSK